MSEQLREPGGQIDSEHQRQQRRQRRRRGGLVAGVAVVAVAAVLALAALLAGDGGGNAGSATGADSDFAGDAGAGAGGDGADGAGGDTGGVDVPAATVDGSALSEIPAGSDDPAVGADAPDVTGQGFAGEPTTLGTPADPAQAIVFLAHWCAHCQAEVPEVVQWIDDGIFPGDVELVAVSTLHRPQQGNWPPHEWLAAEGWPGPVLVDPDESVARAYGMSATPSWVFVDARGEIAQRVKGRMSRGELRDALSAISG